MNTSNRPAAWKKKSRVLLQLTLAAWLALAWTGCGKKEDAGEADNTEKASPSTVRHDLNGGTTVTLDETQQKKIGLEMAPASPGRLTPEIKGFGRVIDPAPLVSLAGDFSASRAAHEASQAELKRLQTLASENNASQRALQAAEAAAARDQAQFESTRLKLIAAWGASIANNPDLTAWAESLGSLRAALVRIDLPAGERLASPPAQARLVTLSGQQWEAAFLETAPSVDPQTQSQGFLFLVQPNSARLAPGEAVTGFLPVPGEPLPGAVIPRSAVLRYEGATWIYLQTAGTNFVRRRVVLDRGLENGWLVTSGVAAGDSVVIVGAQSLLSEELGGGFQSGDRD